MALSEPQLAVANSKKRFRTLISGRRFGKSHLGRRELCRFASMKPNSKVWGVYPTYRSARQIMWAPLKEKLISLNWVKKINETDMRIDLVNGSFIALRGAENNQTLRGVGLDFVLFDEFSDISPDTFYEVIFPALTDRGGHCLFMGTPKGRDNWSYQVYQKGLPNSPERDHWESWQFTTAQGGRVSAEELETAKSNLADRVFAQEFEGTFQNYSGSIYWAFDRSQITDREPNQENSLLLVGMDHNINPMSAVIAERTPDGLYVFDEIVLYSSNTYEMVEEIKARYPKKRIWVFSDPAGAARKTSARDTDHMILRNAGFTVKAPRAHPPVRDRINSVNSLFKSATGDTRLHINSGCKNLIKCLERHSYKEGTSSPEKNGNPDYSHLNDALGYMVHYNFAVTSERESTTPQHWGVQLV